MLPVLPDSLSRLLSLLGPAFTVSSFDTFCWLVHGFIGRLGEHTITGVWQAARLGGVLHHSRAHDFFARRRWSTDDLGLRLAELIVARFLDPKAPIRVVVDDTLFARSGKKVFAAHWLFDAEAKTGRPLKRGNSFVCMGILVGAEVLGARTLCLPILFRLWREDGKTRPELAIDLARLLAERFPEREIEFLGDAYYANTRLGDLPTNVSACVRLRRNAVLHEPAPPRSGKPGRPRKMGQRIGSPAEIVADPKTHWEKVTLTRPDGSSHGVEATWVKGIWYSVLGQRPVKVATCRDPRSPNQPPLIVLSTDPDLSASEILSRYLHRWAIEVAFQEAKGTLGVGEARNRVEQAVERTVPFGFLCQAVTVIWYALNGDPAKDVSRRRRSAPWYRQKTTPSFADMLVALRRELISVEYSPGWVQQHSLAENQPLGAAPRSAVA